MKPKSTKAIEEPTAYAEIGAYLHKDGGKAKVKAYTSVNKPLQVDASEKTEQIKRLRVEMHVVEDKTVDSNSFYTKSVDAVQVSDSSPASSSGFSESDYPNTNAGESKESPSGLQVLKNFVDNIASDLRLWKVVTICAGAVGLVAFVVAVLK